MCFSAKQVSKESKRIDKELKEDKSKVPKKILLLGTGNSGKSTFCKQLSLLYGGDNSHLVYKQSPQLLLDVLKENVLESIKKLSDEAQKLVNSGELKLEPAVLDDLKHMSELVSLDQNAAERISSLWKCEEIRVLLEQKGDSLHLPGGVDGLAHHISRLQEYLSPSYVPTDSDLIRVRIKTTGIVETKFVVEGVTFVVCDVGGQRSERRKWIQCFSKVDAIIYLVATNEYDTTLEESTGFNSMADSLQQFKVISELQLFSSIPFILFFNKFDLFASKISRVPLESVFRDYKAFADENKGSDAEKGVAYFERNYRDNFGGSVCYTYTTCALDKDNCKKVFGTIQDVVIQNALATSGLNM
eukprot:TRINITY_DN8388_c0_g2_i10.p1 TRINITY_DN8388_c0_g2~~TRINITY_DN8388_c0_g2_i10.p1  ORF type:complete len:358 (-),score=61.38 TRINITY_DN8388_c0_g2_i10:52-1125(-)